MATASQRKKTLVVNASARPSVTVKLVGKPYEVHQPKTSLSLMLAEMSGDDGDSMTREGALALKERIDGIVDSLFGKKADEVKARLVDSDDALDIEHVMDTVKKVAEYFGKENPTT